MGIFCLIVMPRVPTEKLIEIAQRELVATDTEKLMEEVKMSEAANDIRKVTYAGMAVNVVIAVL